MTASSPQSHEPIRLSNGYRVRAAQMADCALLPVIERAAAELFRGTGLLDFSDERHLQGHPLSDFTQAVERGHLWVAEGPGGVIGFALARELGPSLHLDELSVHPAHGRRGLGRALVMEVCREGAARGLLPVTLSTFRSVPWNRPFYERLGFRVLDEADHQPWHRQLRIAEAGHLDLKQRCIMAWSG